MTCAHVLSPVETWEWGASDSYKLQVSSPLFHVQGGKVEMRWLEFTTFSVEVEGQTKSNSEYVRSAIGESYFHFDQFGVTGEDCTLPISSWRSVSEPDVTIMEVHGKQPFDHAEISCSGPREGIGRSGGTRGFLSTPVTRRFGEDPETHEQRVVPC